MDSSRSVCRFVLSALGVFAVASHLLAADGEKHSLVSERQAGSLTRVDIALQVGGDLKLVTEGKPRNLPMSVVANVKYDEHLLTVDAENQPRRAIRYYDDARAVIKVEQGGEKPAISEARRLVVAEKPVKAAAVLFCPTGGLSREELDLIDVPANSLVIDRLLPGKSVALGESWKQTDQTLADLLGLEAVSWSDVQSLLNHVADGLAEITTSGSVSGAIGGVSTEIEIKAKYRFDLTAKRITYLAMLIKEKRAVGLIGPGLDTTAKLIVKINDLKESERLTPEVLRKARELTPEVSQLIYTSRGGHFRFLYDRRWFLTSDDSKLAVFRLLDRGELVAQCNISAVPADSSQGVNLAEFQKDVQSSLGKNFGQFINASQSTSDAGYKILRVVVHGNVSKLPIEWVYYLIADDHGQRVSMAFTLEESLVDRFAQADRALVNAVQLPLAGKPTAAKAPNAKTSTAKATSPKATKTNK